VSSQATGDFASTPFPQVLIFLRRRSLGGTLAIEGAGGEDRGRVHFIDGQPACIEVKTVKERLGELMVIRGLINAKTLASALRGMKDRGVRLGRYLLDEGLVKPDDLAQVMRFQLERRLALLYPLTEEHFTFHQGRNLTGLDEQDMYPVDPVPSMPRHLRDAWDMTRIETQLSRLEGHGLRISLATEGNPGWSDAEREALASLDGRTLTLDAILETGSGREPLMQVVLYVLMLTGGLALVDASEAEGAGGPEHGTPEQEPPEPARPASQDPRLKELLREAREKIAQIKEGDLFAVVEVGEDDDVESIRSSYLRLVKKFHPDVASSVEDEKLRESYLFISTKLRDAFDILTDPEKRTGHLRELGGGPSEEEEQAIVQQALSAELTFQKACILARKRKWEETASLMREVVGHSPDNGEYLALLAWSESNIKSTGADLTEQEAKLRKAVGLAPRSERANYYLAQILKRSGKDREARTYLESVVGLNPHNIDAKRELRILQMRQEQPSRASSGSGFLGLGRKDPPERPAEQGKDDGAEKGTLGKLKKILTKKL
jgi:curved DNA-binding protein CbpA